MKKIIRIASVIALASASLLYVGCTKDFSADIAKTNQDVAALNQKIETLNSTVQTINGTVESLKTTKADLSKVEELDAAIKSALEKKIGELEESLKKTAGDATKAAADAAAAKTDAAAAQAAADAVASDLEKTNKKLDSVITDVKGVADSLDIVAANLASVSEDVETLRADVDSLQNWQGEIISAINTLTGRVDALAARVSSIVAVPSMNAEFQKFSIDTAAVGDPKDTILFGATFAVTPKAAVENIKPENLKLNFKQGLTRNEAYKDSTVTNIKVAAINKEKGEITVFAGYKTGLPHGNTALYYSLEFTAKDAASEKEYGVNSEYVKAHGHGEDVTLQNSFVAVKVDGFKKLKDEDKILNDTIPFNAKEGTAFGKLLTTDIVTAAFEVNGGLLSAKELGELVGVTIKVKIDTFPTIDTATVKGFKVTNNGTSLNKADASHVGNKLTIKADGFVINGKKHSCEMYEHHVIGAKTVEYTLPAVSEPWTYTSWEKVSRTVSITDCEDVHNAIPEDGIPEGAFEITQDSGKGVDIAVTDALRNPEAKDTVYNVVFEQKADITKDTPDTVNITINWKYTLEGRPADKTIALANVDTLATGYTSKIKVAIDKDIVAKTYAAFDAAYDKTIDSAAVTTAIKNAGVDIDSVVFGGKIVNAELVDNAVQLPAHSKAGAYSVVLYKTVFGIKYTYTYTINLSWKEELYLHATPYVSAGVAKVDADTTAADGVYTLKEMDMAKYLQVFNADTLAKGFDNYKVKFKTELEDSTYFANEKKDTSRGSITLSPNEVKVNDGVLETAKLDWSNYKGRKVKVTAYLVIADTVKADSCTFTLQYDKPITSFSAGTQTIKRVAGKDASAVLAKSFNIKGLYNGNKNLIVDTTGAWVNGKNNYGCEIEYNIDKASFKVNGETATLVSGTDFEFTDGTDANPETAKIKFYGDNNNKNIEASIPVVLKYKYDYNNVQAYKDNVVIKVVNE